MSYRNRDRVKRVFAHREADRIPYCVPGVAPQVRSLIDSMELSEDHRSFCLEGDFNYIAFNTSKRTDQFLPYLSDLPDHAEIDDWGVATIPLKTHQGYGAGNKTWHPLDSVNAIEELKSYPWPDFTETYRHADLENRIRSSHERDFAVLGQMSQTILETAYEMRGIDRLMLDFYERPDYVFALFEKIAERRIFEARRFAESGADILRIGDDIATQKSLIVGPELYRRFIKPFHTSVIASARSVQPDMPVLYHSDGNIAGLIPDLIDAGVTAIHPTQVECMDLQELKKTYGKDLVFSGCLPTQSVFSRGTSEDVVEHLKFLTRVMARDGGLVVEFYNNLLTPTVLANMKVFFVEFYEMARY